MKRILLLISLLLFTQASLAQVYTDTQGKLEVSASGSAVYTLPIAMPPSAHDTGPVINIVYTSGGFGGIAGQGWNIQSISAISRIATRKDIDGYRDGVDFDDNDKLALDGQRLILKSGDYFAPNSTYETETQSNTKIELIGSDEAMYFVVTAPDGSRSWYGNYDGASAADITSWYIVRFEDTNGNYITYDYVQPFGKSLCISEIHFSGSVYADNPSLINTISFHYKAAQRSEFAYIGGVKHEKEALLERVEVHSEGALFRKYELTHSADGVLGYERLIQVQEFNPENEGANPVIFEYNETETIIEGSEYLTTYNNTLEFEDIVRSGDFDGDGRLDFITNNQLFTKLFEGNAGATPVSLPFEVVNWEPPLVATTLSNNKLNTFQSIVRPQVSGYDLSLTIYNLQGNTVSPTYTKNLTLVNTITKIAADEQCPFGGGGVSAAKPSNYLEGDFNGDGISEVIFTTAQNRVMTYGYELVESVDVEGDITTDEQCVTISNVHDGYDLFIVDLNPDSSTTVGSPGYIHLEDVGNFDLGTYSKKYIMDFNGDGKSDILSVKSDQTYKVIGFKELSTAPYMELELLGSGSLGHYQVDKQLLFGDFNGDGKADLMIPEAEHSEEWNIYYANPLPGGGDFFVEEAHNITEYWPDSGNHYDTQTHFRNYYALDTNGDGKTDLVEVWRKYYKPKWTINDHDTRWKVTTFVNNIGNSNATDTFTEDYVSPCTPLPYPLVGEDCSHHSDSPDLPIPVVGNYRHLGLNKELIMVRNHYDQLTYIDFTKDVARDNRLKKVTTSGGDQVYEIFYAPMEKGEIDPALGTTPLYSVNNPPDYPYVTIEESPKTKLVATLRHTAMGIIREQRYKYRNFTLHMGGLGPLGFEKTAKSAWFTEPTAPRLWSVTENDMALRGASKRTYTRLSSTGTHFSFSDLTIPPDATQITVNSYATAITANKVYSLLLTGQTVSNLLLDTKVETDYSYDPQYNLPVSVTTRRYSGQALQQTHTVTNEYGNNPEGANADYYIGRPYRVSTQTSTYGDVYTTEKTYSYDAKGNVTSLEKKGHNTESLTETMSYDSYGNITQKTLSAPGMASRTTGYEYDPSRRFVIQKTDVEGLETNYTYNPLYGLVLTETNHYELTTTYAYDGWGKKTGVTDELGNSIEYNYNRSGSEYTLTQTGDDGSESFSVSDILGNVIRKGSKDLNENFSYIDIQYDEFNRKIAESEPYFDVPSHWNTIQYDNYSRPTQTTAHTGKITNINYNGLTTSVNDGVKTVTTIKDAMGNVISHSDPGGTIVYTYFANGNLKQSDYDGVIVSIQQDGWGRKTQLSDPSAGVYTYQYNGFGEIIEETTPKGTTAYTYNSEGRLTKKEILGDETDMTTDYSYDPVTKLMTTMEVLSGSEAFTYNYTYDEYQRPVSTTEQTPYAQFERLWQYDSFGRVEKEGYMALHSGDGKTVIKWIRHHYKNGYSWQITDDVTGNLLWETTTVNARGQLTQGTYGNGIIATNAYDAYGLPTLYSHDKDTGDGMENRMLLEFEFNAQRGTLNSRNSSLFNWQETFSYDELDRLTGFTDNNGSHEQTYDNRGRITHNQGIGEYSYGPSHPYQAAQVALTEEAHDYYQERGRQSISYNAFKKPVSIRVVGRERIDFNYNTFKGRSAMFYGSDAEGIEDRPLQKHYAFDGSMEIKSNATSGETTFIFYLGGDAYSVPVVLKSDGEASEFLYLHRDYLGSILAITDQEGEILEKRHFDPWGNIVHLQDGNNTPLPLGGAGGGMLLDRGYTGHEHLQGVELIHMNGRLYDPLLHRFLAPDNYVQDPYNTQNFNRYGYVYNNPLMYTDPSGEVAWFVPVLIGAAVSAATYTVTALTADVPFTAKGIITATLIGGVSGAATFGISEAVSTIGNLATRITVQTLTQGGFQGFASGVQGGNFWQGFASGALSSLASSLWVGGSNFDAKGNITSTWNGIGGKFAQSGVGEITFGTISGGGGAALSGGNFWEGAATGFAVSSINYLARDRGKTIVYKRTTETDESTIGNFNIPGTDIEGYFLEPPGPSTTTPNQNRRIPEGTYNLEWNTGSKYPDALRLYNDEVPRSRAILIHKGNYPTDTLGCLLPGSSSSTNFVGSSRPIFEKIINHFRNVGINGAKIVIHDPVIR